MSSSQGKGDGPATDTGVAMDTRLDVERLDKEGETLPDTPSTPIGASKKPAKKAWFKKGEKNSKPEEEKELTEEEEEAQQKKKKAEEQNFGNYLVSLISLI